MTPWNDGEPVPAVVAQISPDAADLKIVPELCSARVLPAVGKNVPVKLAGAVSHAVDTFVPVLN